MTKLLNGCTQKTVQSGNKMARQPRTRSKSSGKVAKGKEGNLQTDEQENLPAADTKRKQVASKGTNNKRKETAANKGGQGKKAKVAGNSLSEEEDVQVVETSAGQQEEKENDVEKGSVEDEGEDDESIGGSVNTDTGRNLSPTVFMCCSGSLCIQQKKECDTQHRCPECGGYLHGLCGELRDEDTPGWTSHNSWVCFPCTHKKRKSGKREIAHVLQKKNIHVFTNTCKNFCTR